MNADEEKMDCGLWIVDCGLWIVDCGLWIVDWVIFGREGAGVGGNVKAVPVFIDGRLTVVCFSGATFAAAADGFRRSLGVRLGLVKEQAGMPVSRGGVFSMRAFGCELSFIKFMNTYHYRRAALGLTLHGPFSLNRRRRREVGPFVVAAGVLVGVAGFLVGLLV